MQINLPECAQLVLWQRAIHVAENGLEIDGDQTHDDILGKRNRSDNILHI